MRVSPFVSVLFAASLLGGVALADRPSEDGGSGRSHAVQPREMRTHEAREARESRQQSDVQKPVREGRMSEKLRSHGDVNEHYGSHSAASAKGGSGSVSSIKAQRDADKALHRLTDKATNVQNCSPTDDTCHSSRVAKTSDKSEKAATEKAAQDKQRQELKAQIDRLRAAKLKEMVMKNLCQKHANMCADNL